MAIQDEIDRLSGNVADTYSALSDLGAEMPDEQNSDNLADTARTVKTGGTSVQSDWSVNDDTDPAYVKNRTHYTDADGIAVPLDESYIPSTIMRAANPVGTGSFSLNRKAGTTVGNYSHAEGNSCTASGSASHAEGYYATASGQYSHAEGNFTTASGNTSHAEGYYATASGQYAHAEGYITTAQRKSQHVQGEYNVQDTEGSTTTRGKYAHIVGNGTSASARSNAHTLDWNGVGWFAGGVKVGGDSQDSDDAKEVLLSGAAAQVGAADTGSYYVRNIKFSTEAETPTVEGDICFKLE